MIILYNNDNDIIGTATDRYAGPERHFLLPAEIDIKDIYAYRRGAGDTLQPIIPTSITRRQARRELLSRDLLDIVETAIDNIEDEATKKAVQIDWEDAQEFEREWPTLLLIAERLEWADSFLDELFISAAKR